MSGPPYPHPNPPPQSNAIGQFQIGVSPIGTIAAFDFWITVISQYANSPILTQLIVNFFQYIDPTADLDAFYDQIWNVATASGYGLDVWGRIVGVTRTVALSGPTQYFGFEEGSSYVGFNQEAFYSGNAATNNVELADGAFRTLIFAKALSNISNGSIPAINQLLLNLFPGRGNCYVVDNNNMTMEYKFVFGLSAVEQIIVSQTGLLPKPVGVSATVVF